MLYHDSHDPIFRSPFGALTCGQTVTLRLMVDLSKRIEQCFLRLWIKDQEVCLPMSEIDSSISQRLFEIKYQAPPDPGILWYYFVVKSDSKTYYYGNNKLKLGGKGEMSHQEPPSYQITVYEPSVVPKWYKNGIIYQIFVDRFYNGNEQQRIVNPKCKALLHMDWYDTPFYIKDKLGNVIRWDFFGGNLKGIRKKLPYLKDLGVTILYLNPIFEASSNHKYDTGDYLKIDTMFGDDAEFQLLMEGAQRFGIDIMLDGVFSHTGADSVYFNKYHNYPELGAYQSPDSPYFRWYTFDDYPEGYQAWWGVKDLPEVNELETTYKNFIYGSENSVIQTWMKKGVKGWRLDVADELPDEFIQELRQTMKQIDPEAVLLGEVWEDATNKMSYGKLREYFWGRELDSTMNYPIRDVFIGFLLGRMDAGHLHQSIMSLYENYPRENFYAAMNLIGSHDRQRILTVLGEAPPEDSLTEREREAYHLSSAARELGMKRLKLFILLQMTFPGVPSIYYGDEAGLEGYSDPYNRKTFPWGKEDQDILQWHKRMIGLRQEHSILRDGDFISFYCNPHVYGFRRRGKDEEIVILANPHYDLTTVNLEVTSGFGFKVIDLLEGVQLGHYVGEEIKVEVPPQSGRSLLFLTDHWGPIAKRLNRSCGILLHISSLPSPYGIGDFGKEAYAFIDFLKKAGHSIWQILPINPTGIGDSPYQSESAYAGNVMFISMDKLVDENLLSAEEVQIEWSKFVGPDQENKPSMVEVKGLKEKILHKAYLKFGELLTQNPSTYVSEVNYHAFLEENKDWLEEYELFRYLKERYGERPWQEWEESIVDVKKPFTFECNFVRFVQYTFYTQWKELKAYANANGIRILGDMPIFVSGDSCDVWAHQDLFKLGAGGKPLMVAGVPPDYFSPTGQLWGNPVYDWKRHKETKYNWWKRRFSQALLLYDSIRLDHFRGFEAYWEVAAEASDAVDGNWVKGPGKDFFLALCQELGELPFVAEDLGIITPEVNVLKESFGFLGMKVLQFNPLEEIANLNNKNYIYYTSTHDNDTLVGWLKKVGTDSNKPNMEEYDKILKNFYRTNAQCVIIPMQDILGLDSDARMNTPGTVSNNWQWRLEKDYVNHAFINRLKRFATMSGRIP